jgi:putative flavoprotein involved in K+ transport
VSDVDQWLSEFDQALTQGDSEGAAALFHEESFWRDLVAFTWNLKTLEGPEEIKDMLDFALAQTQPSHWHTTEPPETADGITTAWIAFETATGRGNGLLRLRDGKAWTLLTALYELKGHEEPRGTHRPKGVSMGPRASASPGSRSASGKPRRSATPSSRRS